jgi:hypothetical protein
MKLLKSLLFTTVALGFVLSLGLYTENGQQGKNSLIGANPLKVNQQQYERIQEPAMFVNSSK